MEKRRLDVVLFANNIVSSREKARGYILAGKVFADGQRRDKPSYLVLNEATVELKGDECLYVSRGGLKLEKALEVFNIDLSGKVGIDVGASTGGFTHCALLNGAKKIYAVDVGYGQLAYSLRQDNRVCVMERTNARFLTKEMFSEEIDFAVVDAAFISLKLLIPPLIDILCGEGIIVALIKPQFEAGKNKVGKKGVVRDSEVHIEVINDIVSFTKEKGLIVLGITYSPIKGPNGNIEFLIYLTKNTNCINLDIDIAKMVKEIYFS